MNKTFDSSDSNKKGYFNLKRTHYPGILLTRVRSSISL